MEPTADNPVIAFDGSELVASGDAPVVATAAKQRLDATPTASVLIFDAVTSRSVEIDFRGTIEDVLTRLPHPLAEQTATRSPGRPKLGVVAREITLLPRHWEWLATQPGGASATLRKLVETARRASAPADRRREAQESTYRFALAMAGDAADFEEAIRALYAGDDERFAEQTDTWPPAVRDHARTLAAVAFASAEE